MGKTADKLGRMTLWIFILFIPTQLGRHFWPEWSKVWGVRSDYLSPTLYMVDMVWWGLFLINLRKTRIKTSFWWVLGLVMVGVNILIARNSEVAVYRWLRLGQWWWTWEYVKANKTIVKRYLGQIVPWWIGVESLLGLAQLVNAESLNGWWWWLGERRFSLITVGIAQWSVWGRESLRAYGTFSHPNSMAGFLLLALSWWYLNKPQTTNHKPQTTNYKLQIREVGWWVVAWLGILGVVISGSRTVWTMLIIGIGYLVLRKMKKKAGVGMVVMLGGLALMVVGLVGTTYRMGDFLGGWDREGVTKRMSLNISGLKMWWESPMLGVGAGNFLVRLPDYQAENRLYWWQPAHNIFLLGVAEIGILGVVWAVLFLGGEEVERWWCKKRCWWILAVVLVTGMVDHYWLTLPQNMWLLAVILGVL